jgi:hypothetical protein
VNLAPADQRHDHVAGLLHLETMFDDLAMVLGHFDGAGIAEEVRGVKHVHVEAVALDPLAAIEQAPQIANWPLADGHAAGILHRPDRAHLVGHGADAADPRGEIGSFAEGAPAQERLEEARRLVDAELTSRTSRPSMRTYIAPSPSTRAR